MPPIYKARVLINALFCVWQVRLSPQKEVENATKMGAFKIADERALQDKEAVQEIKRQQRAKQAEMDKREASAKARGRARTPKEEVEWALEKSGKKEYSRDSHKSVATAASGGKALYRVDWSF